MKAYHFLRDDMTSSQGAEPPWQVGEERSMGGELILCERGYHHSPSWYDALGYDPGHIACIVEVSDPVAGDGTKAVSRTRKLIAAASIEHVLRLWACECAERALLTQRGAGREPDPRSWRAIEVARAYTMDAASIEDLVAARSAASSAAWSAAWLAASSAARSTAWLAAESAAESARSADADAWLAELAWQRQRLNEMVDAVFTEVRR